MRNRAAAIVLGLLVAAPSALGAERAQRLLPVDEAGKDPSFFAFRKELIDAVRRRVECGVGTVDSDTAADQLQQQRAGRRLAGDSLQRLER